jgi:Alginate lyase
MDNVINITLLTMHTLHLIPLSRLVPRTNRRPRHLPDLFAIVVAICSLLCVSAVVRADEASSSRSQVFCGDVSALAANKTALAGGNTSLQPAWQKLQAEADRALTASPHSVMEKKQLPPSGDKHDFLSWAPYYWSDPNSPDGKYVRRDGQRNPVADEGSDAGHFEKLCSDVHTLALAFYFSGDEKYAAKAADLIRVWFLNPATRMNPNLNFGQGVPGEVSGRPAGLISARGLVGLVDGIGLLAGSKSWTPADQQGMVAWCTDYFKWLTTSKIGLGESAATNNHGTFYDVQATALALYIGQTDAARNILQAARTKRIARQIQPDGKMPRELARTLSFNYSLFNLEALMDLASIGQGAGVDLWHYQTADGRSILQAVKFLAPYADPERAWPYQQIHKPDRGALAGLLLRAIAQFPDSGLQDDLKFFNRGELAISATRLDFKTAPLK